MANRSAWKLSELTYAEVKENDYQVAVLPIGATEPHNLHLPYSTDTLESTIMGESICERAHALGAKVVLLPTIPYGTETNQRRCKLSMNLNPSTLYRLVTDLVQSLENHGIYKVMILNSHGGNELKPHLRELYGTTKVQLFLCDWFRIVKDCYGEIFDNPDDHAGEMETSFALARFPELVEMKTDGTLRADEGVPAPTRFEALNEGWVSITRPWHLLTTNTGCGNPHQATAQKGEKLIETVVGRVAPFLKELSDADLDERFPF